MKGMSRMCLIVGISQEVIEMNPKSDEELRKMRQELIASRKDPGPPKPRYVSKKTKECIR